MKISQSELDRVNEELTNAADEKINNLQDKDKNK